MTVADGGGKLAFYGQDPIIASPFRFGSMAAIGLAAKSVAVAALWKHRTGEGQDISLDVRKALRALLRILRGEVGDYQRPAALCVGLRRQPLLEDTALPRDTRWTSCELFSTSIPGSVHAPSTSCDAARVPSRSTTRFCSGGRMSWRPLRQSRVSSWGRCARTMSFAGSFSIPRFSHICR